MTGVTKMNANKEIKEVNLSLNDTVNLFFDVLSSHQPQQTDPHNHGFEKSHSLPIQ